MVSDIPITDAGDPRIAEYHNLSDGDLLRAHDAFVAEGRLVVRRLLTQSWYRTRSVLVTPAARASLADVLTEADVPVFVCSLDLLQQITGHDIHRGCLAIGNRPEARAPQTLLVSGFAEGRPENDPFVVLEGIGNADNVGGIFRNAAAFGAAGVVLGPGCCDPLYRKAIRTSMGAALTVPFAFDASWPAFLADLRNAGWTIVALTPAADAQDLDAYRRERHARIAIVLGNEGSGLSASALGAADRRVRIPMRGGTDSLNVVVAAGITLHALTRQDD
jgi:tRNA G18 (ribose-2'-O)-methylase SpoU